MVSIELTTDLHQIGATSSITSSIRNSRGAIIAVKYNIDINENISSNEHIMPAHSMLTILSNNMSNIYYRRIPLTSWQCRCSRDDHRRHSTIDEENEKNHDDVVNSEQVATTSNVVFNENVNAPTITDQGLQHGQNYNVTSNEDYRAIVTTIERASNTIESAMGNTDTATVTSSSDNVAPNNVQLDANNTTTTPIVSDTVQATGSSDATEQATNSPLQSDASSAPTQTTVAKPLMVLSYEASIDNDPTCSMNADSNNHADGECVKDKLANEKGMESSKTQDAVLQEHCPSDTQTTTTLTITPPNISQNNDTPNTLTPPTVDQKPDTPVIIKPTTPTADSKTVPSPSTTQIKSHQNTHAQQKVAHPPLRKCASETRGDNLSSHYLNPVNEQQPVLWDWPFAEDGLARCYVIDDTFSVALNFAYLKPNKNSEVKKFENLKSSSFSFQVGLCSLEKKSKTGAKTTDGGVFWRLEMQILAGMNMIIIEATRDIRQDAKRDPAAARRMKTLRRIYRLPPDFDITTLQTSTSGGSLVLQAKKHKKVAVNTNTNVAMHRSHSMDVDNK